MDETIKNNQEGPKTGILDQKKPDGVSQEDLNAVGPGPGEHPEADKHLDKKTNLKTPFEQQSEDMRERMNKSRKPKPLNESDKAASDAMNALNQAGPGKNVQDELDELEKISEEDLKLAEEMIFKGYAEFSVEIPNLKGNNVTICSTSAEEISMIDEVVFDMVNNAQDSDSNSISLPQQHVNSMRNALFVAMSYRGRNEEELSGDSSYYLNSIKHAIQRITDLENNGELAKSEKLKKSVKKAMIKRATLVKRMSTPMIDFLSGEKVNFEEKMYNIISSKNILSKS